MLKRFKGAASPSTKKRLLKLKQEQIELKFELFSRRLTSVICKASFMQDSREELESYDCVNDHDKNNEERYVKEGDHGHEDRIEHNLET